MIPMPNLAFTSPSFMMISQLDFSKVYTSTSFTCEECLDFSPDYLQPRRPRDNERWEKLKKKFEK